MFQELLRANSQAHHIEVLLFDIALSKITLLVLNFNGLDGVLVVKDYVVVLRWVLFSGDLIFLEGVILTIDLLLREFFLLKELVRSDLGV